MARQLKVACRQRGGEASLFLRTESSLRSRACCSLTLPSTLQTCLKRHVSRPVAKDATRVQRKATFAKSPSIREVTQSHRMDAASQPEIQAERVDVRPPHSASRGVPARVGPHQRHGSADDAKPAPGGMRSSAQPDDPALLEVLLLQTAADSVQYEREAARLSERVAVLTEQVAGQRDELHSAQQQRGRNEAKLQLMKVEKDELQHLLGQQQRGAGVEAAAKEKYSALQAQFSDVLRTLVAERDALAECKDAHAKEIAALQKQVHTLQAQHSVKQAEQQATLQQRTAAADVQQDQARAAELAALQEATRAARAQCEREVKHRMSAEQSREELAEACRRVRRRRTLQSRHLLKQMR
jgi:hypothetical protein